MKKIILVTIICLLCISLSSTSKAYKLKIYGKGNYQVWGAPESIDARSFNPDVTYRQSQYVFLGNKNGNSTIDVSSNYQNICIASKNIFCLDAVSFGNLYAGQNVDLIDWYTPNDYEKNLNIYGIPDNKFMRLGEDCHGCSGYTGYAIFQKNYSKKFFHNLQFNVGYIETIENIFSLGNPKRPIPISEWGANFPENFLYYDTDNYYVVQKEIHGRKVTLAAEKIIDYVNQSDLEDQARFLFNIWDYYWSIFKGFPFGSYTVVYLSDDYRAPGGQGIGYEHVWNSPDQRFAPKSVAHEVFHAWNGGGNAATSTNSSEAKWFVEGATDYYGIRASALCGLNVRQFISVQYDFNIIFKTYLDKYLNTIKPAMIDNNYSLQQISKWHDDPTITGHEKAWHYNVGLLVAYLLDKKLNSQGTNLDLFFRYLYNKLNYGRKYYNSKILENLLSQFTGHDYSQFFNDYIYGTKPLPIDKDTFVTFFKNTTSNNRFLQLVFDGDVNDDEVINIADAIVALQVANEIRPLKSINFDADVDKDGKIGLAEVLYNLNNLVKR